MMRRPLVEEGNSTGKHGTVICKLCVRHGKNNNFTGEGYQCGPPFPITCFEQSKKE